MFAARQALVIGKVQLHGPHGSPAPRVSSRTFGLACRQRLEESLTLISQDDMPGLAGLRLPDKNCSRV